MIRNTDASWGWPARTFHWVIALMVVVMFGFGLWMDFNWSKHGWRTDDPEQNYFSPEGFAASVSKALHKLGIDPDKPNPARA